MACRLRQAVSGQVEHESVVRCLQRTTCPSGACTARTSKKEAVTGTINYGQPIQQAPVLSVDRLGNLTVAFATGDQADFSTASGSSSADLFGAVSYAWVWSLRENALNGNMPDVLWYQGMNGGERVTGPLTLFNSTVYFTTSVPSSTSSCSTSAARLYGVDYILTQNVTTSNGVSVADPSWGGLVRLKGSSSNC